MGWTPVPRPPFQDVLDPACAPGVSHIEPGGITTRQLIDLLHSIEPLAGVVGGDVRIHFALANDNMSLLQRPGPPPTHTHTHTRARHAQLLDAGGNLCPVGVVS